MLQRQLRQSFPALLLVMLLSLPAFADATTQPTTTQPATTESDHWFRVNLSGKQAGWSRSRVTFKSGGQEIQTAEEIHLSLQRAGTQLKIELFTTTLEKLDGTPISVKVEQNLGDAMTTTLVEAQPDQFIVTRGRGNDQIREIVPISSDSKIDNKTESPQTAPATTRPLVPIRWFPAAAGDRYVRAQLNQKATDIRYATMDPSVAVQIKTIHMVANGIETIQVMGKPVPTTRWTQTVSGMEALPTRLWLDDQGEAVKVSTSLLPGLEMSMERCEPAEAKATISVQELLISTLISPDHVIESPRTQRQGTYELHFSDAEKPGTDPASVAGAAPGTKFKPPVIPRAGSQRVVWDNRTTALVIIDLDDAVTPENDLPKEADLKPSLLIDFENAKVKATVAEALNATDAKAEPATKAEVLRKFVYHFINHKDLSVGMGSASETIDSHHGDCTEHAVLLAALLRASKIPSRTVMGLVYADAFAGRKGVFGYHMWTQAWLDLPNEDGVKTGRWVDLDATLSPDQPFDATHIALYISSLADNRSSEEMVSLTPIIGRMTINVVVSPPTTQPK